MRINKAVTIVSGTPIQLSPIPLIVSRISIQAKSGGTGVIQVMDGIPAGTTPGANGTTAGQLTFEISAAGASAPGGNYTDRAYEKDGGGINLQLIWIDGSHSGDVATISYDQRV